MRDTDGVPRVTIRTPKELFDELRRTGQDILTWQGELVQLAFAVNWLLCYFITYYLSSFYSHLCMSMCLSVYQFFELHQGTFTSQASTKRHNRLSERMIHDVEVLSVLAHAMYGVIYPRAQIEAVWKTILLYVWCCELLRSSSPFVCGCIHCSLLSSAFRLTIWHLQIETSSMMCCLAPPSAWCMKTRKSFMLRQSKMPNS